MVVAIADEVVADDDAAGFAPKLNVDGELPEREPKPTEALLVSVAGEDVADLPKVIGDADSAGFGAAEGEPKLKVGALGAASFFEEGDSVVGLVPNEKPLEPKDTAGLGSSFFSLAALLLSVVSVAGFAPKLNPVDGVEDVVAVVPLPLLLLPNENLGLSSEIGAAVAAGLLPTVNPPEAGAVVELEAGTPKENPVFGASLLAESASFGTPKLNPEPVIDAAAGLLPNENDGALAGVEPGLACSQQAHLLRVASLRVMQALHSHLPADCCATKLLKP